MSWQQYVDSNLVGTKKVSQGAIFGLDGSVWAKSSTLNTNANEGKAIANGFGNPNGFAATGIVVGGVKYMFLRAQDNVVIGKKGQSGVHIAKTVKAIIVGIYDQPIVPSETAVVVEKLADYLKGVGF